LDIIKESRINSSTSRKELSIEESRKASQQSSIDRYASCDNPPSPSPVYSFSIIILTTRIPILTLSATAAIPDIKTMMNGLVVQFILLLLLLLLLLLWK